MVGIPHAPLNVRHRDMCVMGGQRRTSASVESCNHLILGQWLDVVNVESFGCQYMAHVLWYELMIELRCDRELCDAVSATEAMQNGPHTRLERYIP